MWNSRGEGCLYELHDSRFVCKGKGRRRQKDCLTKRRIRFSDMSATGVLVSTTAKGYDGCHTRSFKLFKASVPLGATPPPRHSIPGGVILSWGSPGGSDPLFPVTSTMVMGRLSAASRPSDGNRHGIHRPVQSRVSSNSKAGRGEVGR